MTRLHLRPLCRPLAYVEARRSVVTVCLPLRHLEADGEPRPMRQLMLVIAQMLLLCYMCIILGMPMFVLFSRQTLLP